MTQNGYPFEQQPTTETQYAALAGEWQDSGIAGGYGSAGLAVSASGSGMTVSVAPGGAILRGTFYENTDAVSLTIGTASGSPRIDVVVVRMNPDSNTTVLAVVPGTPAASPVAPPLTQVVGGIFELELAQVAVAASAVAIADANVTDRRRFVGGRVGVWKTDTRPATPRLYRLGYNVTRAKWEYWDGVLWVDLIPSTVPNAETVGGLQIIVSATTPTGTPTASRVWIKPVSG